MEGVRECALIKKQKLRRAYDQVHAQANALLQFSLQWKDLEEHYDSIWRIFNDRLRTVKAREQATEERIKAAELKEETIRSVLQRYYECELEISKKEERLGFLQQQIECFEQQMVERENLLVSQRLETDSLALKEKELGSVLQRLELEIISKEKNLGSLQQKIESCSQEMKEKEMSLDSMEERLSKCTIECEKKEREFMSLSCDSYRCRLDIAEEKTELSLIKQKISASHENLCSKEKELSSISLRLDESKLEILNKEEKLRFLQERFDFYEREVGEKEISLQNCSKQLDSKKEVLSVIQSSLDECCSMLDTKEEKLISVENSIERYESQIKAKAKELVDRTEELESINKSILSKQEQLHTMEGKIQKVWNDIQTSVLELKSNQIMAMSALIDEKSGALAAIFHEQLKANEFKLQQQGIRRSAHTVSAISVPITDNRGAESKDRTLGEEELRPRKRRNSPAA